MMPRWVRTALPAAAAPARTFDDVFREQFADLFAVLFRYLDRLTGDPALASDVAQEVLVRLHARGVMPDDVRAWAVTVAHNRLRSHYRDTRRRAWLLRWRPGAAPVADPAPRPDEAAEADARRATVRAALDRLPERERRMLLLRAEGHSYREIAQALRLAEASVGTLLARAKRAFLLAIGEDPRASE